MRGARWCLAVGALSALACNRFRPAVELPAPEGGVVDAATAEDLECGLTTDAGGDLPCEVAAALRKCQTCHQAPPKNHAPWPLLTYEDTQAPFGMTGLRKWQRMAQVIEPGNLPHMPPNSAPQLSEGELRALEAWFAACAPPLPEGTGCDAADAGGR